MQKTAEIPACKIGLPAEKYFVPVVRFDGDEVTFEFSDMEKMPASLFYRWLNNMAALCDLHTRFIAQDGWYEETSDRWSAIETLIGIAYRHGKHKPLRGQIYTEERVRKIRSAMLTQKRRAVKNGATE